MPPIATNKEDRHLKEIRQKCIKSGNREYAMDFGGREVEGNGKQTIETASQCLKGILKNQEWGLSTVGQAWTPVLGRVRLEDCHKF